ncbi:MAG: NUDIX hydrolase [Pseudomonadota bacterium]
MPEPEADSSRLYPSRPIVGVGGLVFDGRSVLLIKRAKDPGRGRWSIPGGAVDLGETLPQGLKREMLEEVGLKVEVGPLVEAVDRIFTDANGRIRYHYVVLDYLCFPGPGEPKPGSDAAEARFVPPEEWADYGLGRLGLKILHQALKTYEALQEDK